MFVTFFLFLCVVIKRAIGILALFIKGLNGRNIYVVSLGSVFIVAV